MDHEPIASALAGVFQHVIPEIVLVGSACAMFLGGTVWPRRHLWGVAALVALIASACILYLPGDSPEPMEPAARVATFAVPLVLDPVTQFARFVAVFGEVVLEE